VTISILFSDGSSPTTAARSDTTFDLRLDELFDRLIEARPDADLASALFTPLATAAEVRDRQDVFADLETAGLRPVLEEFGEGMRRVRRLLEGMTKLHAQRQQQAWLLDAAGRYCSTIEQLATELRPPRPIISRGLTAIRDHLDGLLGSEPYQALRRDFAEVREQLHAIRYRLTIVDNTIVVDDDEGEADASQAVLDTFERFRQRESPPPSERRPVVPAMNHVDAAVLDLVARLHPTEFGALAEFGRRHADFIDPTVARFDREIQFYLAFLELLDPLRARGLTVCRPEVSDTDLSVDAEDVYDLALANKLVASGETVVLNDLTLSGNERIIVVSGPNQGGKTTFARIFGQLHYLAALGVPVPGRTVRLGLFDAIWTHFERTEDLRSLSGKLEDELVRIHRILEQSTPRSIIVMNETFGSTSLYDARLLGEAVLRQMIDLDLRALYVTFVEELSRVGPTLVSMVSTVDADDPARRTFKILRRPADGRAYATLLAERHGLSPAALKERIRA
jgi:DNA mismatch repair protein MutS